MATRTHPGMIFALFIPPLLGLGLPGVIGFPARVAQLPAVLAQVEHLPFLIALEEGSVEFMAH